MQAAKKSNMRESLSKGALHVQYPNLVYTPRARSLVLALNLRIGTAQQNAHSPRLCRMRAKPALEDVRACSLRFRDEARAADWARGPRLLRHDQGTLWAQGAMAADGRLHGRRAVVLIAHHANFLDEAEDLLGREGRHRRGPRTMRLAKLRLCDLPPARCLRVQPQPHDVAAQRSEVHKLVSAVVSSVARGTLDIAMEGRFAPSEEQIQEVHTVLAGHLPRRERDLDQRNEDHGREEAEADHPRHRGARLLLARLPQGLVHGRLKLGQRQGQRVGGQQHAGPRGSNRFHEDVALDLEVVGHGLEHDVGVLGSLTHRIATKNPSRRLPFERPPRLVA
mmetsp:Transcript_101680/g.327982  ORF Transcript_101680/g.327982 Transcript_101680/m.327982 type:complete len:336 (+) Transcript_101680:579-1586(+)